MNSRAGVLVIDSFTLVSDIMIFTGSSIIGISWKQTILINFEGNFVYSSHQWLSLYGFLRLSTPSLDLSVSCFAVVHAITTGHFYWKLHRSFHVNWAHHQQLFSQPPLTPPPGFFSAPVKGTTIHATCQRVVLDSFSLQPPHQRMPKTCRFHFILISFVPLLSPNSPPFLEQPSMILHMI